MSIDIVHKHSYRSVLPVLGDFIFLYRIAYLLHSTVFKDYNQNLCMAYSINSYNFSQYYFVLLASIFELSSRWPGSGILDAAYFHLF